MLATVVTTTATLSSNSRVPLFFIHFTSVLRKQFAVNDNSFQIWCTKVLFLLTGLWIRGTVYQTGLSQLTRLTRLKTDWINFGGIRRLCIIFEFNWKEPEVVVKYSLIRYYNYVINICVIELGIEILACACEFRLRLTSTSCFLGKRSVISECSH